MDLQQRPTLYAATAAFLQTYSLLIVQIMQADTENLKRFIAENHGDTAWHYVFGSDRKTEVEITGLYPLIGAEALTSYVTSLALPGVYDPVMLDFEYTIPVEQSIVTKMISIMSAIFIRWKQRYQFNERLIELCVEEALEHFAHQEVSRDRCLKWLAEARDGFFAHFADDVLPATQTGWHEWITSEEAIDEYISKGWAGQEEDTPMIVENIYIWGWKQLEQLMIRMWPAPDPDRPS
jgi:hypothetical protein